MKLYGLIGYPLSHSFSAEFFNNKFRNENIDSEYLNFPLNDINNLPLLLKSNPRLSGFNVTIPFKEKIIPFLDQIDPVAKNAGAVNTVVIKKGKLTGFNTDITGFEKSFITENIQEKKALILGSGGASKAVQCVLNKNKIDYLIVTRNPKDQTQIGYSEIGLYINDFLLIINTTPVGTYPETEVCPDIPYHMLNKRHILFDLIYNPAKTKFLQQGEKAGTTIKNGHGMLVIQAEEAWRLWNTDL